MSKEISLNGKTYLVERCTLRDWVHLEDIKNKIKKAAEVRNVDELSSSIVSYISAALAEEISWQDIPWIEIAKVFQDIDIVNRVSMEFPILRQQTKEDKAIWDYPGRTWYLWSHMLASEYGWNIEYIANLDVDDAIAMLQEIALSGQLDREWEWMLSEVAYPYDPQTKSSRFKELPRPDWMAIPYENRIKKIRIRKDLLPIGNVISDVKH